MRQTDTPHLQLELDKLTDCIHCGLCLPACPTYQATGSEAESPRGRLYLMKKLLNGELAGAAVAPHLDQCLACHGCETVCPSGVQYGSVLMAAREDLAKQSHTPGRWFKRAAFRWLLPNHALLLLGGRVLRAYQQSGLQALVRKTGLLKPFGTLARQEVLLPEIPAHRKLNVGQSFGNPQHERVALLVGCVMDVFYNPVHRDTIDVLMANGYYVKIPEQTCCGALAHHAGETDITRRLAKRNIDAMLAGEPKWIVVNSAGCGSTMQDYGNLLADEPEYADKARQFSDKVIDVMALLAKKPLAPFAGDYNETLTYHAACHLYHVQGVRNEPIDVLHQVPGLTLVPLTDMSACCGSAGIYNIEHPDLSAEVLSAKITHVADAAAQGATTVVTGNPGCMLQLDHGLKQVGSTMSVAHPVSVLADAYRRKRR